MLFTTVAKKLIQLKNRGNFGPKILNKPVAISGLELKIDPGNKHTKRLKLCKKNCGVNCSFSSVYCTPQLLLYFSVDSLMQVPHSLSQ